MTWDVVCHVLQPFNVKEMVKSNFEQADTLLLMDSSALDRPNTIYVTASAALPRPFHHALMVALGACPAEADNRIVLEQGDLAQVFNALASAKSWLDTLSSTLALCHSDQEILDRSSLHMGVPMFYLDESYRILAMTKSLDFSGDEEWIHMREKGYLSPKNAQKMKDAGDLDKLALARKPILYHSDIYPFPSITSNVWLGGHFVSRLTVLCINGDTSPLILRACELVTAQLRRVWERSDRLSDSGPLQSMLLDLLHGVHLSDELIADRLRSAPYLSGSVMQLFFADVKAQDDRQLASYYASLLQRLYPEEHFLPVVWQEQLLLLSYASDEAGLNSLTAKLSHFFTHHHLRCGVSNPFRHIRDLHGFFHQALAALESEQQSGLSFYRTITLERILAYIPEEQVPFLISPDIPRLEESEGQYSFSLLDTLRAYLECNCNLIRTAEHLYVHKNTLLYRLNHIKSILRCDLNDADERLLLMLSFKLLERGC